MPDPLCPLCGNKPVGKHWSQFGWLYTCNCGQGSFWGDKRDIKPVVFVERKKTVRKRKVKIDNNQKLTAVK